MFNHLVVIGIEGQYRCFLNVSRDDAIERYRQHIEVTWGVEHCDQFLRDASIFEHDFDDHFIATGIWYVTDNRIKG